MKLFGCKLTHSDNINGKFNVFFFSHDLHFVPDACHMLKLARNALADFGVLLFDGTEKIESKYTSMLHEIHKYAPRNTQVCSTKYISMLHEIHKYAPRNSSCRGFELCKQVIQPSHQLPADKNEGQHKQRKP